MPEIHRSTLYVIPADAISLPFAQRRGRVRSTQGMPENHQHSPITATPPPTTTRPRVRSPHVIPADAGNQRKTKHAISTPKTPNHQPVSQFAPQFQSPFPQTQQLTSTALLY